MRKLAFLLGLSTILLISYACRKQVVLGETANLDLQFKLLYDGAPLIFGNFYDYGSETKITINRFGYYISDVVLLGDFGADELELKEIDFLNYEQVDSPVPVVAPIINSRINKIPTGNYSNIRLGIGVNSDLNTSSNSDFSTSHPLGQPELYWEEFQTYIFTLINGGFDTNGDGEIDSDIDFRAGTSNLYQEVTIPIQLMLSNNETGALSFTVDIKRLLELSNSEMLAVEELANNIDSPDFSIMKKVMEKFPEAIQLE